jgi:DNA-binding MarR family transcriptional regulator
MKAATKRRILLAISEGDPHHFKAVEIASSLGVSRADVSAEVKVLIEAGLCWEVQGKTLSLTPEGEKALEEVLEQYHKLANAIALEFHLSLRESHRLARSLLEGTY